MIDKTKEVIDKTKEVIDKTLPINLYCQVGAYSCHLRVQLKGTIKQCVELLNRA
jgi:hypothetical protein